MLEALGFSLVWEETPYLGLVLRDGRGPVIADVLDDSPAGEVGLAPGDEITRLQGLPFHAKALPYLKQHETALHMQVRRGARMLEYTVPVGRRTALSAVIWQGDEEQRRRLETWLGGPFALAVGNRLDLSPYDNFHGIQAVA